VPGIPMNGYVSTHTWHSWAQPQIKETDQDCITFDDVIEPEAKPWLHHVNQEYQKLARILQSIGKAEDAQSIARRIRWEWPSSYLQQ